MEAEREQWKRHLKGYFPYPVFVLNRVIDTEIGVLIAIGINAIHLPKKVEKDTILVSGVDPVMLNSKGQISDYTRIELNLNNRGMDAYRIISYDSTDYPGYAYIKIYTKQASREAMLFQLKRLYGFENSKVFGSIEGHCDVLVTHLKEDGLAKSVRQHFKGRKRK